MEQEEAALISLIVAIFIGCTLARLVERIVDTLNKSSVQKGSRDPRKIGF